MINISDRRVTVTSALPYIHGVPHLGNIVGSILPADIFHRYLDVKGVDNVYICGSDVHGTPLELEAIENDIPVEELKERNHEKVKKVLERFDMDFSIYSDTHSEYNRKQTYDMFEELYVNGYITEEAQTLPYCKNDERFLPDRYIEGECPHCSGLARGDQCDDCGRLVEPEDLINPVCQICGKRNIEFRETTHFFLDLPQFKDELREWLENADPRPVPKSSYKEVMNAIENVEPRAITRDINWGFDVPYERVNSRIEDEGLNVEKIDEERYKDKVLYVWFDAPIGYIGFTRELFDDGEEWKDYWADENTDVYYSIGKDNTIFHTIIWPSMLMGSSTKEKRYNLPHYEFIHQFLLAEDTKFSKSRGKGLNTEDALDMYPTDYWRFYLATELPQQHDTTFSWESFENRINKVLNDTVGNFVNRPLSLAEQWFDNKVPDGDLDPRDEKTLQEAQEIVNEYEECFENHDMKQALDKALALARLGDQYLSEEEPWNNEDRREPVLLVALKMIRGLSVLLYPFTPDASRRIADMLNTQIHIEEGHDELSNALGSEVQPGHKLGDRELLFEKIDVEEKREEMGMGVEEGGKEGDIKHEKEGETMEPVSDKTVSFDEFKRLDMRVAEVLKAEPIEDSDNLVRLVVDIGTEERQIIAGIKQLHDIEGLPGEKIIVVANLEPAEIFGYESNGMLLAAGDQADLLTTMGNAKPGEKVE